MDMLLLANVFMAIFFRRTKIVTLQRWTKEMVIAESKKEN
jgi:hypothetical protein